jgi:hypothetical protein
MFKYLLYSSSKFIKIEGKGRGIGTEGRKNPTGQAGNSSNEVVYGWLGPL